jgi:FKBP-type peptidyl-prolyl cis-trans isomerase FkpA
MTIATLHPLRAAGVLAASLLLATACKPIDKDVASADAASGDAAAGKPLADIPGLRTEKEQASYVIGTQIGNTLKPAREEIDMAAMTKGIRTALDGGKPLIDDAQAMEVFQAFNERMQARATAEAEEAAKKNLAEGEAFLASNKAAEGVQVTASGLQYKVVKAGEGPKPTAQDRVRVHYKGSLLDGTEFDSSYGRGEPATFAVDQVVPGWQEALQLMPVGSHYQVWVPAALGYGEAGTPGGPIGPNATLAFEVELLEILPAGAE